MTHTTSAASTSTASTMGNGNKKSTSNSFLSDDLHENSTKVNGSVIIKWTLTEVQTWVKEQCKKFELKKTTAENFQMNGQALMLLTKHDFIRRSPHGGEILYYALQRLITPNKAVNLTNINSNLLRNGSTDAHPRIVELSADHVEQNGATGASSSQPIVEEPDDPPAIRRSNSDIEQNNYQQQQYNQPYIFNSANIPQTVLTMQAGTAAAFFQQHHQEQQQQQQQQQQQYPNAYMYPYHHHPHMHINQQPVFYPPMFQQYYPMMSAQGILIEIMDDEEPKNANSNEVNGSTSGTNHTTKELLFMVTVNGQRYIMNEAQVIQLVTDVYQQQNYQTQLQQQQQQLFQQQQQQRVFQQQQQQRVFQQRQNFYQK